MQNKTNSSLSTASLLLFFLGYPIYLIYNNINMVQLSNLWESIVEYKYWIFLVIFIHLIFILLEKAHFKKPKFLKLFCLWRKPIIILIIFIYPLLSDFQQRFGQIYENNVTDFYAIFLPIFIMFIVTSLIPTGDPVFLEEMKDTLSIKSKTNEKVNSLIINASKSITILAYAFIFLMLVWWMCRTNKVNSEYKNSFVIYPLAFFCLSFGVCLLLNTILNNKPDIRTSTKSNITNTNKQKNNNKKDSHENIKVSFK